MKIGDRRQMLSTKGQPLDAHFRIKDIDSESEVTISFESAGGTDRNQDFSEGFEALLNCLATSRVSVQNARKGEAEKRLTLPFPIDLTGLSDARKTRLRFTGTEGRKGEGFSTSSVARIDMDLRMNQPGPLLAILESASTPAGQFAPDSPAPSVRRRDYPIDQIKAFSKVEIDQALDRIDSKGIEPHRRNTTYAVVARGRLYPPVAVAAFAIEAMGKDPVPAGSLRGSWNSPAFKLLQAADCLITRLDERGDEEGRLLKEADHRKRPPIDKVGSRQPKTRTRPVVEYDRDPWVVAYVLERTEGVCESCDEPAPFLRRRGGGPYLEVHHVVPLSEGGPDTVDNAVGICPNCHARCHQGKDHLDFNAALYEKVPALLRP